MASAAELSLTLSRLQTQESEARAHVLALLSRLSAESSKCRSACKRRSDEMSSVIAVTTHLSSSLPAIESLESKLKRFNLEETAARKAASVLRAFLKTASAIEDGKLQQEENEDGELSALLENLCLAVSDESKWKVAAKKLHANASKRKKDKLIAFDAARRKNDVDEMKLHVNYLKKHDDGVETICEHVAKQAMRPLWAAARAPPGRDDVALLFEQVRVAIFEAKATLSLVFAPTTTVIDLDVYDDDDDKSSVRRINDDAIALFIERVTRLILSDDGALVALLQSWFPPLQSPPPGVAVERIELLTATKFQMIELIRDALSANSFDEAELYGRVTRLFERSSSDYIALEISLLEYRYATYAPKLDDFKDENDDPVMALERALLGRYPEFLKEFAEHTAGAYERAHAFLEDEAREACMETLTNCFLLRAVDGIIVPMCDQSAKLFSTSGRSSEEPIAHKTSRAGFETPSHELLVNSSLGFARKSSWTSAPSAALAINMNDSSFASRIQYLSEILIPFVEEQCDVLEMLHDHAAAAVIDGFAGGDGEQTVRPLISLNKRVKAMVDTKLALLENRVESILAKVTDLAFYQALEVVQFLANKNKEVFDVVTTTAEGGHGGDDPAFAAALEQLTRACTMLNCLGEGVATNLALVARELAMARLGALKKVSGTTGAQNLARELNKFATRVEEIVHVESTESRAVVNRVCSELRQVAHAFVMPKEEVLKGSLVLDKIGKELAAACVALRR